MKKLYLLQSTIDGKFLCHHSGDFTQTDRSKAARWSAMSSESAMRHIAIWKYGKCPIADQVKIVPLTHSEIEDNLRHN